MLKRTSASELNCTCGTPTIMLNVIAYIRVSTKQQAERGNSLEGQRLQIREYAKARQLSVKRFYEDDSSARNEEEGSERSGFKGACAQSLRTGWPILVVDASRFSRTEETYERFVSTGGKVYDLSGFGDDEATMRAKIKRAKFDGDIRSKTTSEGHAKAKASGKKLGSPCIEKACEASAISRKSTSVIRHREFERLHEQAAKAGATTPNDLTNWLNRKGHLTTQGRPWTASNVRRVLAGLPQAKTLHGAPIQSSNEALASSVMQTANGAEEKVIIYGYELDVLKVVILKNLELGKISQERHDYLLGVISNPMSCELRERIVTQRVKSRALKLANDDFMEDIDAGYYDDLA